MESLESYRSALSGELIAPELVVPIRALNHSLQHFLENVHPKVDPNGYLSAEELRQLEKEHLSKLLLKKNGNLSGFNQNALDSIADDTLISLNLDQTSPEVFSFKDRLSDGLASFVGSWTFILCFVFTLVVWISLNVFLLTGARSFDPFPFILLNLCLSCIAAIQAPLIMMSQNRMEAKDRTRAVNDYQVNLKAEIEIRQLHQKVDLLAVKQQH